MNAKYILTIFLLLLLAGTATASSTMDINISGQAQDGYQMRVQIPIEAGMNADFGNIRFFSNNSFENGGISLPYWIESHDDDSAIVWYPLPANCHKVVLEWGIEGEIASESNGSQVFDWFDGFDDTVLNGTSWLIPTNYTIENGLCTVSVTTNRLIGKYPIDLSTQVLRYKVNSTTTDGHNSGVTNVSSTTQSGTSRWQIQIGGTPLALRCYIGGTSGTNPTMMPSQSVTANEFYTFELRKDGSNGAIGTVQNSSGFTSSYTRTNDAYATSEQTAYFYGTGSGTTHDQSYDYVLVRKYAANKPVATIGTTSNAVPVANFTSDIKKAANPAIVQFTDTSTGNPTYWLWNFGDGNYSTEQNPAHVYSTATNRTVSLYAGNMYGVSNITKTNYMQIYGTRFGWCGQDWVVRTTTGNPGGNYWGLTQESVWIDGNDRLHLTAKNINGIWYASEIISVDSHRYGTYVWKEYDSPLMNQDHNLITGMFVYNYTNGRANEIDIEPSRWSDQVTSLPWSLTGSSDDALWLTNQPWNGIENRRTYVAEGSEYKNAKNVTYQFSWYPDRVHWHITAENGDVIADWTCTNITGIPRVFTKTEINYWANDSLGYTPTEGNAPFDGQTHEIIFDSFSYTPLDSVVNLTSNKAVASLPQNISFYDASTRNTSSWFWDFGDGQTSTEQNPVHFYETAGNYTISLTATNETGSYTATKSLQIVEPPAQVLEVSPATVQDNLKTVYINSTDITTVSTANYYGTVMNEISNGYAIASIIALVLGAMLVLRIFGY